MTYSSLLTDNKIPLVLDTSVLINLHASRYGDLILDALPNDIIVSRIVVDELEYETNKAKGEQKFIQDMVAIDKISVTYLSESEYRLFSNFVSGSPSLGDGEAATISVGVSRGHLPIIDERKGRLRAQERLHGNRPGWSLDLFRHPRVVAALGAREAADALYLALRDGRMRVHEDHCDQVVGIIGVQRAIECNSLPGYKGRRDRWRCQLSRLDESRGE